MRNIYRKKKVFQGKNLLLSSKDLNRKQFLKLNVWCLATKDFKAFSSRAFISIHVSSLELSDNLQLGSEVTMSEKSTNINSDFLD